MLDDIVDSLPKYVTKGLNGGIYLVPEVKPHPQLPFPQYLVMGQYRFDPVLGASIVVFYDSIMAKYLDASTDKMKAALKEIVLHEFRHHMETRAGCRDLADEDAMYVAQAKAAEKGGTME